MSAANTRPVIVFAGDSVTDCGRRTDPEGLGDGYVRHLATSPVLDGILVVNRGIAGDRSRDLRARWATDVLAARPAVVSIMIGINDTWRRFDSGDVTTAADYESNLRAMLDPTIERGIGVVMVEPFAVPTGVVQPAWRDDLDPKLDVARALAAEYRAALVPLDTSFRNEIRAGASAADDLAGDGVHPAPLGHERIAALWLQHTAELVRALREP
jgi:acyl-CoA thioesterase-1